jgi:hypothetical protein
VDVNAVAGHDLGRLHDRHEDAAADALRYVTRDSHGRSHAEAAFDGAWKVVDVGVDPELFAAVTIRNEAVAGRRLERSRRQPDAEDRRARRK